MKFTHAQLIEREARFPAGHRQGYAGFVSDLVRLRRDFYQEFIDRGALKQPDVDEVLAAFDDLPPECFAQPYVLSDAAIEQLRRRVQRKYVVRFKNIRRTWAQLLQYLPELMVEGRPARDVLEMSSAHGATLEILRAKGHRVIGNDFPNFLGKNVQVNTRFREVNGADLTQMRDDHGLLSGDGTISQWPYQPIIESLGLDVRLFDAGQTPYPFEAKSFDTVICFDAIEHYCHPRYWMTIIAEFVRLARRSVLVVANPVQAHLLEDADYMADFHAFQRSMRQYDEYGFECVHAGINRHQLTVFKLAATGVAPPAPVAAKPAQKPASRRGKPAPRGAS